MSLHPEGLVESAAGGGQVDVDPGRWRPPCYLRLWRPDQKPVGGRAET